MGVSARRGWERNARNPEDHLNCRPRPPRMSGNARTRCRHPSRDAGNRASFAGLRCRGAQRQGAPCKLRRAISMVEIARAIRLTRHDFDDARPRPSSRPRPATQVVFGITRRSDQSTAAVGRRLFVGRRYWRHRHPAVFASFRSMHGRHPIKGCPTGTSVNKGRPTAARALIHATSENPGWIAGRGRLEGRGFDVAETASSETDCTRDSVTDPAANRNRAYRGVPQSGERDAVSRVPPEEAATGDPGGIRAGNER